MSKVFLIGRRRTGTATIIKALKMVDVEESSILTGEWKLGIDDLLEKAKDYDVIAVTRDYDLNEIRAIEARYPDCRFVLTTRQSDQWYASFVRYYGKQKRPNPQVIHTNKGHYVSVFYEKYNKDVETHFSGRDWKLLRFKLDGTHSWQVFCSYFKKGIPSEKFPHENISKK